MINLILPMAQIPAVIRESTRSAFAAHATRGYKIIGRDGKPLTDVQLTELFNEFGRNAAQALFSIDQSED